MTIRLLAGLLLLLALASPCTAGAQDGSGRRQIGSPDRASTQERVLVLYSARQGQPSFAAFDSALESDLNQRLGGQLDLYREFLDNGRFALTDEYLGTFRTYLRDKYRDRPDVVVAVALAAVDFLNQYGEELFPGTPFLFVATTDRRPKYGTNVFSDTDWNGSLKLARQLQPRTRQVFVITGASEFDLRALSGARQQFADLQPRLDFTYLTGLRIEELERRVAALTPDSIIYYVNMTLDGAQRRFEGTSALDRIAAVANVPIYIQSQALGGHLWSSLPWGLRSSEIVMRLLDGESADTIPPSKVEIYSAQLDWRQIQRWNIDQRRIPAGTHILFREPSLWETYQGYVLGAVALMLLQSALIGGLLVQQRHRRRIEESLRESERRYRVTAEQNQDLSGRLINAQEEERARIARDLHDDVSQQLAGVGITLSGLKRKLGQPELQAELMQTVNILQERNTALANSVRNISHALHPDVLRHAGLNPTLKRHCADMERQHQVKVEFSAEDVVDSPGPDVALCLFRVAQEALTNAVRHARATTIRVHVAARDGSIELSIVDDGIGFADDDRSPIGMGLRSIDERVRLVRGTVTVESRPGHGTTLVARVPLGEQPVETVAT
jgi:signal transduction histidine kinase